jgi:hypothetical protein
LVTLHLLPLTIFPDRPRDTFLECSSMNKQVGQVIVKVWVAAGIAIVGATALANPLNMPETPSGPSFGTIVPAERAMAVQPAAPNVKFEPATTQPRSRATANGTSQAANQAANQAATLGPVCGSCGRAAPPQAATQAANQSANQAATLGPNGISW